MRIRNAREGDCLGPGAIVADEDRDEDLSNLDLAALARKVVRTVTPDPISADRAELRGRMLAAIESAQMESDLARRDMPDLRCVSSRTSQFPGKAILHIDALNDQLAALRRYLEEMRNA